jgi:hypothetical protein
MRHLNLAPARTLVPAVRAAHIDAIVHLAGFYNGRAAASPGREAAGLKMLWQRLKNRLRGYFAGPAGGGGPG